MSNIFSELKKMSHQFSNALSTMFQLRLVEILHFDTFPLKSAQKSMFCMISIYRFGFLTSNVDFIRNINAVEASYEDIGYDVRTPKGPPYSPQKPQ